MEVDLDFSLDEEEAEEDNEWVDHSNASALEEYANALEQVLAAWSLDGAVSAKAWTVKSGEGDTVGQGIWYQSVNIRSEEYAVATLFAGTQSSKHKGGSLPQELEHFTPTALSVLNLSADSFLDFPLDYQHPLRLWFGVEDYVVLQETNLPRKKFWDLSALSGWGAQRSVVTDSASGIQMSAVSIALSASNCSIPVFVQSSHRAEAWTPRDEKLLDGDCYSGVALPGAHHGGAAMYFESRLFRSTQLLPPSAQNLAGVINLFSSQLWPDRSKLRGPDSQAVAQAKNKLLNGDIFVSVRFTWAKTVMKSKAQRISADAVGWSEWVNDDVSWRYKRHPARRRGSRVEVMNGPVGAPLWGPLADPLVALKLYAIWPRFREGTFVQNAVYSNLLVEASPLWMVLPEWRDEEEDSTPLASGLLSLNRLLMDTKAYPSDLMLSSFANEGFAESQLLPEARDGIQTSPVSQQMTEGTLQELIHRIIASTFLFADEEFRRTGQWLSSDQHADQFERILAQNMGETEHKNYAKVREKAHHELKHAVCKNIRVELHAETTELHFCGAPPGSLLSVLSLRGLPALGTDISAVACLWNEFVFEVRWHWENAIPFVLNRGEGVSDGDAVEREQCFGLVHLTQSSQCLIQQKLQLLNNCIFLVMARSGNAEYPSLAEGEDHFFDAQSQQENSDQDAEPGAFDSWELGNGSTGRIPLTYENCFMTTDDVSSLVNLLASAPNVKEEKEADLTASNAAAFKAANPAGTFEDFRQWEKRFIKVRNDSFSEADWNQVAAKSLLKHSIVNRLSVDAEAEKVLHYLETIEPCDLFNQLCGVGMASAAYLLRHALADLESLEATREQLTTLQKSVRQAFNENECLSTFVHGPLKGDKITERSIGEQRILTERIKCCETMLSRVMTLTNHFDATVVDKSISSQSGSGNGEACPELVIRASSEQEHTRDEIRKFFSRGGAWEPPDIQEFLLRCVTKRPAVVLPNSASFDVRCGANRLYAALTADKIRLATVYTESSF